jgi:hypothetical protein
MPGLPGTRGVFLPGECMHYLLLVMQTLAMWYTIHDLIAFALLSAKA